MHCLWKDRFDSELGEKYWLALLTFWRKSLILKAAYPVLERFSFVSFSHNKKPKKMYYILWSGSFFFFLPKFPKFTSALAMNLTFLPLERLSQEIVPHKLTESIDSFIHWTRYLLLTFTMSRLTSPATIKDFFYIATAKLEGAEHKQHSLWSTGSKELALF